MHRDVIRVIHLESKDGLNPDKAEGLVRLPGTVTEMEHQRGHLLSVAGI